MKQITVVQMGAMMPIAVLASLFFCSCGNGAGTGGGGKEEIYLFGTEAYDQKVGSFALSPQQAFDLLMEKKQADALAKGKEPKALLVGRHFVIVKDEYLFSMPDRLGIGLQGYCVHGQSGEIRSGAAKTTYETLTPKIQRKLWGVTAQSSAVFRASARLSDAEARQP